MSNLRYRTALLEENISLRREKDDLCEKFDNFVSEMREYMSQIQYELQEIKNNRTIISQKNFNIETEHSYSKMKESDSVPFIPSSNVEDMKVNVGDLKRQKRISNVSGAAKKLLEIQGKD